MPAALAAGSRSRCCCRARPRDRAPPVASGHASAPANAAAPRQREPTNSTQLHTRSQTLERWIAAVAAHAPQNSRDLMAAVEVEDLIGLVDVQLGAARDDADALPLWRQRVALLEDLADDPRQRVRDRRQRRDANAYAASLNRIN